MTREDKQSVISICRILADKMDDSGKVAVEQVISAVESVEEQEPFMNKPCVANQVCHEDKVKVIDKIRAEIVEDIERYNDIYDDTCHGLRMALDIIDKHKTESEEQA